jgi:hypothetical protein
MITSLRRKQAVYFRTNVLFIKMKIQTICTAVRLSASCFTRREKISSDPDVPAGRPADDNLVLVFCRRMGQESRTEVRFKNSENMAPIRRDSQLRRRHSWKRFFQKTAAVSID